VAIIFSLLLTNKTVITDIAAITDGRFIHVDKQVAMIAACIQ
jgi:hypothetical protein